MYKLEDIKLERVNLDFIFDKEIKNVYIENELDNSFEKIKLETNNNTATLNISDVKNGTMLSKGKWELIVDDDIEVSQDIIKNIDSKSKIFRYRGGKYAYLAYFELDEEGNFILNTNFMMENKKPEKFYRLNEGRNLLKKGIIIFKLFGVFVFNIYYKLVRLLSINKNHILFLTENADELNGNLKMMYEYTLNKKGKRKVKYYADNKYVGKKRGYEYIIETTKIARSNIIFVDNYTPLLTHIKLSKKVKLVQLWHAGIGFKAVGYARFGIKGSPHPYKSCHRKYTHAFVAQDNLIPIYSEVFGTTKDIFKAYGMPRLDGYLSKEKITETVSRLEQLDESFTKSKVILFAPTYRGTGSATAYYDYDLIDQGDIFKFCKENNYIFVVKMHPFVQEHIKIHPEFKDYIKDYSDIDINDLIYVTDIMITDYSSCAYEYSLFNRPLIFYRFDEVFYEYERPMHTVDAFTDKQYKVNTFEELMEVLKKTNKEVKEDRFKDFEYKENQNSCEKIYNDVIGD